MVEWSGKGDNPPLETGRMSSGRGLVGAELEGLMHVSTLLMGIAILSANDPSQPGVPGTDVGTYENPIVELALAGEARLTHERDVRPP